MLNECPVCNSDLLNISINQDHITVNVICSKFSKENKDRAHFNITLLNTASGEAICIQRIYVGKYLICYDQNSEIVIYRNWKRVSSLKDQSIELFKSLKSISAIQNYLLLQ